MGLGSFFANIVKGSTKQKKYEDKSRKGITSIQRSSLFAIDTQGDIKLNLEVMNAIFTHARHLGTVKYYHSRDGDRKKDRLSYLLSLRPNPLMSADAFYSAVAYHYYLYTNAFIYLEYDKAYNIKNIWLLEPASIELKVSENKDIYFKFQLNGGVVFASIEDMVVLSRNISRDYVFGDNNESLKQTSNLLGHNYEFMQQALNNSSFIYYLMSYPTVIDDDVLKTKADKFRANYLNVKDGAGVIAVDNKAKFETINPPNVQYIKREELEFLKSNVYENMGVSAAILTSKFTEEEWQAYYQGTLKPFISALQSELMYKCLTTREIEKGSSIDAESDQLQFVSLKTKISLVKEIGQFGALSVNDICKIIGLPKLDPKLGDIRPASLNFVDLPVKNEYQLSGITPQQGGGEDGQE